MRQVSARQSATLLLISCRSVQPVPARVEEPVSPVRQSSSGGVTKNIHPFPRRPKPARESRLSKLAFSCQCVFRHRRRTRPTTTLCSQTISQFFLLIIFYPVPHDFQEVLLRLEPVVAHVGDLVRGVDLKRLDHQALAIFCKYCTRESDVN